MSVPQLILTLNSSGNPVIELPGLNGSRRKIELEPKHESITAIGNAIEVLRQVANLDPELQSRANEAANNLNTILISDNTFSDIIIRILEAQVQNKVKIGEDGAPTQQQIKHWERHSNIWGDPSCPFCIVEGKFEPGKNREKSIKGLNIAEALKLGLLQRGFVQSKNNENIYTKPKTNLIATIRGEKVFDKNQIQWSKTQIENLIEDGKNYAKRNGFQSKPKEKKISLKRKGVTVRTVSYKNVKSIPTKDLTIF